MEESTDSTSNNSTRKCITAILCGRTSLFVLMTGYALLGALIFKAIEGGDEEVLVADFHKSREDCLKELWLITENVEILRLRKQHIKEVLTLIESYYYPEDKTCRAVGLPDVPEAVEELNNLCIEAARCGMCLIAIDKDTNIVAGVMLNVIYIGLEEIISIPGLPDFLQQVKDNIKKTEEICKHTISRCVVDIMSKDMFSLFDRFNTNCILENNILCIHPDHRNTGIGHKLGKLTLELARCLYKVALRLWMKVHLWNQERLNVLYEKNWTKLVTEQLKRFERAVIASGRVDGTISDVQSHWTFGGALFYSITLLTTIGYGRLSPRTAMGKAVAVIYAFIGVPLMLVLLSALGSLLASGARKLYSKLCCQNHRNSTKSPSVGYHKAPSSPSSKRYCKTHEDLASIQLMPTAALHAHTNNYHHNCIKSSPTMDHQEVPKRVILATVRAPRTRGGRCRQGAVRQTLTDAPPVICPAHPQQPIKNHVTLNSSIVGIATTADLDDADDTDDNEHSHDTPSRIPLIWRPPDANSSGSRSPVHQQSTPSVPGLLVLLLFVCYVCAGAATFSSIHSSWSFLDALYYCFVALSTISPGERLPAGPSPTAQAQLLAWAIYLFVGLAVVAMCFSLVHEEVVHRCRQLTRWMGLNSQADERHR